MTAVAANLYGPEWTYKGVINTIEGLFGLIWTYMGVMLETGNRVYVYSVTGVQIPSSLPTNR